jgi:hypothetical protein
MDDMNAFERLVGEETRAEAGPARPTDVAAVVRSVATKSPKWRFWSMFTATKTLAATAIVVLFGGLLLVGPLRPIQDMAVVPAAESPGERGDPVQFEARWAYGDQMPGGDYVFSDDGWYEGIDLSWAPVVIDPGDPRLDGQLMLQASTIQKDDIEIWNGAFRLENGDGAWQQRPMVQSVKLADDRDPMTWTAVFDGEGAYDGLTAVVGITRYGGGWDLEGVIIDGSLPPTPSILTRE